MHILQLQNRYIESVQDFLARDPISNLYLLDLIDRQGIDFWGLHRWTGAFKQGKLIALNADIACLEQGLPAKLSVPVGDPNACRLLGEQTASQGGTERIMAERTAALAFYDGLGSPQYRISYAQQLLYTQSEPENALPLEAATQADYEQLVEYTALLRIEDEEFDPRERDFDLWKQTVSILISQQRILIHKKNNEIVFVVEIGTRSQRGAQVGSIYVPPQFRRKGFALSGVHGTTKALIQQCSLISLLVNEHNIPARRCYDKAGWIVHSNFQLIEMDI